MSDSESESDLNVSCYDPEDNLNIYGSPIYTEQAENVDEEQPGPSNVLVDQPNRRTEVSFDCVKKSACIVYCCKIFNYCFTI
jgi:hypothetical protein